MRNIVLAAIMVAAGTSTAEERNESAFGFHKGMTLKQAKAVAPLKHSSHSHYEYGTVKPPRPVDPFVYYMVSVGPTVGVCMVDAQTDWHPRSSKKHLQTFMEVMKLLTEKYGDATKTIEDGAMWANVRGAGSHLMMRVNTRDDGQADVSVTYGFSNVNKCVEEMREGL